VGQRTCRRIRCLAVGAASSRRQGKRCFCCCRFQFGRVTCLIFRILFVTPSPEASSTSTSGVLQGRCDLYCEVIGAVQSGTWSHRGRNIAGNTGSVADNSLLTSENDDDIRYRYTIETHSDRGRYYSAWLDFRLRIHNATERDSGVYRFAVVGPSGDVDEQAVYVDISYSARSSSVYGKAKPRDAGQKKGANEQAVAVRSGSMDDDGARNRRSEAAAAAAAEMDDGHEAG
jgi:hypothetical protein